ncbi:acetoin dehydrogenase [Oleiphilus sp. HI0009]|uniref:SDR family NAD(P)-dependent oxidoreductase n=2 Tax=Oleiphilus TaxID=141450 RepID=UPI0007C2CDB3|nr:MULTISPECIES: SDR family NAD(P)-dependent oxidoreductase [unclassified Oleiphilus]KZX86222.1 acetoin dehydrogenase [Oleiphilus sp. HI0009]KZY67086.1 acetoin dehydrogenase [Oleiphilus sp. HI0066]KZY75657.1 acetoin dehydrogenase [Oleiphilus sp. HI0067]KZZ56833.1 acetoin dehydrogenase [Oleiphilus sp. HI0125]
MKSFKNKVCVVTGAGSGIGRSLAIQLADAGALLAISDVNQASLDETLNLLSLPHKDVMTMLVDVSKREQMEAFAEKVEDTYGRADLVINNAGVALMQTVEDTSYEDFEWLMDINFWGVVYGTKSFLPLLKRSSDGAIVNISSVFGLVGIPTQGAYNASKFAVKGYTEALRLELKNTPVTPITVHPGGIKTNIVNSARFYRGTNAGQEHKDVKSLFDRLTFTTPDQAASTILKGVKRKKMKILIGKDAYFYDWAGRWLPESYHRIVDKIMGAEF